MMDTKVRAPRASKPDKGTSRAMILTMGTQNSGPQERKCQKNLTRHEGRDAKMASIPNMDRSQAQPKWAMSAETMERASCEEFKRAPF